MGTKARFEGAVSRLQDLHGPTGCTADVLGVEWVKGALRARFFFFFLFEPLNWRETQSRVQVAAPIWKKKKKKERRKMTKSET